MTTVVIRVDAGPTVGLGHLMRCLGLAAALEEAGARTHFVTRAHPGARAWIAAQGAALDELDPRLDLDADGGATAAVVARVEAGAVVVDSRAVDKQYLARLVATGALVVSIDDLAQHVLPSHVIVNGNVFAPGLLYRAEFPEVSLLRGPRYVMLRPPFWDPPVRVVRPVVGRVLVTVGGHDGHGLLPGLLKALDVLPAEIGLVVAPPPLAAGTTGMALPAVHRPLEMLPSPDALPGAMREADIAVSGGGQTVYELAAVGCPAVALPSAGDQDDHLRALAEHGVVLAAGGADPVRAAVALVAALVDDPGRRQRLADTGQRLVDGHGARRVAAAVLSALAAREGR